ncbi:TetR/AcrR family transcriptional regulator [Tsukamurella sp. 1534]|uniref:TetR/AcrR family transcriptional regulator n=1 Tax=Tsukamurella sp. 1534 TaxID=1151061 RepID=UPI00030595D8|nr:TetR/AcrR family transcriptional regulator [Tsukamurella sp. 1534]
MARPRKFDPADALDAATESFWSHGYAGTSPADLETAMGISRSSLYNTFHTKADLYRRALEHYAEEQSRQVLTILEGPEPATARLRAALNHVVRLSLDDAERRGCLVTNAAIERAQDDDAVRALLRRILDGQAAAFAAVVDEGRRAGEIAAGVDPAAAGNLFVATTNGIRVLARVDPSEERLAALTDAAMRAVETD